MKWILLSIIMYTWLSRTILIKFIQLFCPSCPGWSFQSILPPMQYLRHIKHPSLISSDHSDASSSIFWKYQATHSWEVSQSCYRRLRLRLYYWVPTWFNAKRSFLIPLLCTVSNPSSQSSNRSFSSSLLRVIQHSPLLSLLLIDWEILTYPHIQC